MAAAAQPAVVVAVASSTTAQHQPSHVRADLPPCAAGAAKAPGTHDNNACCPLTHPRTLLTLGGSDSGSTGSDATTNRVGSRGSRYQASPGQV